MFKRLAAVAAVVVGLSAGIVPAPASADFQFSPANVSSLASLFPDTCIPWGTSGVCITFTNASYLTQFATAQNSVQMGQMLSQGLQDGRIGDLASQFGVSDPIGYQFQMSVAAAIASNPSNPALAAAQAYQRQSQGSTNDNQALYQAMQTNGVGSLSAEQLNGVALMRLLSAVKQQNDLTAASQVQSAQVARTQLQQVGSLLDVTNTNATAGWNF